jgi:hypothetical protein
VRTPALAKRFARALPSFPVPPIIATIGIEIAFDMFASSKDIF